MGVNFNEVLDRMQEAARLKNMSAVARDLGVTPQALSNYKKRGEMPTDLAVKFALAHGLSIDWLIFGRGEGPAGVISPDPSLSIMGDQKHSQKALYPSHLSPQTSSINYFRKLTIMFGKKKNCIL